MDWSDEQQAIFGWFARGKGNLVVRARAGTGKTTTILEAINRAPERKILLAAFNKTIAEELTARLGSSAAEAKTLHALGYSYVRRMLPKCRVDNRKQWELAREVCGSSATSAVLRLVGDLCTKARDIAPRIAKLDKPTAISTLEELALVYDLTLATSDEIDPLVWNDAVCADRAFEAMLLAAERTETIDFADMIFLPLHHGWVSPRYDMVVIDEAQDMSGPQLELAQRACRKGGRIAIVGDDRQAIYGFRGADSSALDRLKQALAAVELGLKTTYRCPRAVVERAALLVPDYTAAPSAPAGVVRACGDARDTLLMQAQAGDFVLSRINAPLVALCLALIKRGTPACVRGRDLSQGLRRLCRGFEDRGARDLVALRSKIDAHCQLELDKLDQRVAEGSLRAEVAEIAADRLIDSRDVVLALADGLTTFAELYARFDTLFTDDADGAVVFSTVHKAKGLESARVWLLEQTFRQARRAGDNDCSPDGPGWRTGKEEQNIRYVAITRSKHELVWLQGGLD